MKIPRHRLGRYVLPLCPIRRLDRCNGTSPPAGTSDASSALHDNPACLYIVIHHLSHHTQPGLGSNKATNRGSTHRTQASASRGKQSSALSTSKPSRDAVAPSPSDDSSRSLLAYHMSLHCAAVTAAPDRRRAFVGTKTAHSSPRCHHALFTLAPPNCSHSDLSTKSASS